MNKTEILNRPDFEYLVCACIKKYKLYTRINRVGLTIDEFIQEVRTLIWTRKLPNKELAISTFIYRKTLFTLGELITSQSRQKLRHKEYTNKEIFKSVSDNHVREVDNADFMEEMIEVSRLSYTERTDLENILGGMTQRDASKARGVSNRAVFQSYYRCIEKMKNMKGVLGEV
jgi:hypothetical protein